MATAPSTTYTDYMSQRPTPVGGFGGAIANDTGAPQGPDTTRADRSRKSSSPLRKSTRAKLAKAAEEADEAINDAISSYADEQNGSDLGGFVRREFEQARRHRDTSGVSERMLHCLRAYNGEYSPTQLAEIQKLGGSEAFARITAVKCRTLVALLSELYLGPERPWRLEPTPVPSLPEDITASVETLVDGERQAMMASAGVLPVGAAPFADESALDARREALMADALRAAKEKAAAAADAATERLDDDLVEGQFYAALRAFLFHFSLFPVAILKGPFYRMTKKVAYVDGKPTVVSRPLQFYNAPSPFDVWFGPGVQRPEDGPVFERIPYARQDLEALADLDTYNGEAINSFLAAHPSGFSESFLSSVEQGRRDEESRESALMNDSGLYDMLEFHGWVRGDVLASDAAFVDQTPPDEEDIDPLRSYHVTIRMVADMVVSAHFNPDPLERPIYHTASFEEVPGSVYGRGLPEVLVDSQGLGNAALRALINNIGLASGPQVAMNTGVMSETEDTGTMFPWKRWPFVADPAAPTAPPIVFFQPTDNSQSLFAVLEKAMLLADEMSAIPRYAAGSDRVSGAARTASGLAQLQGNVSRLVRHTAKGIDESVIAPKLQFLYDMRMLDPDDTTFRGDETIVPLGVQSAAKAEAERMRAIEFLQLTANPIDAQLLGPDGRLLLLAEVADNLGFDERKLGAVLTKRREQLEKQGVDPTAAPAAQGGPQAPRQPEEGDQRPQASLEGAVRPRTTAELAGNGNRG